VALAWVLRNPAVSSAIIGATSTAQLEQNLKAVELKLSDAEWREVETLAANAPPRAAAAKRKAAAKPAGAAKKQAAARRPAAKPRAKK
jgi:diketogulonate reductase-like aldo/keto reductase